jgi:hypothetical protein
VQRPSGGADLGRRLDLGARARVDAGRHVAVDGRVERLHAPLRVLQGHRVLLVVPVGEEVDLR